MFRFIFIPTIYIYYFSLLLLGEERRLLLLYRKQVGKSDVLLRLSYSCPIIPYHTHIHFLKRIIIGYCYTLKSGEVIFKYSITLLRISEIHRESQLSLLSNCTFRDTETSLQLVTLLV